jgi:alanine racemase
MPVLTLKARIGAVRELPAGHTVSYGATYALSRPSRVATVLIGYGDGYPRRLSNRGELLIHGRRAPIIGRVCMDQIVVDVTDLPAAVAAGDECICIGVDGSESITAESIAQAIQTTEHEITTCLTSRLPRIYCNTPPISC